MGGGYRLAVRVVRQIEIAVEAPTLEEAVRLAWRYYEGGNLPLESEAAVRAVEVVPLERMEPLAEPPTHRTVNLMTGDVEYRTLTPPPPPPPPAEASAEAEAPAKKARRTASSRKNKQH